MGSPSCLAPRDAVEEEELELCDKLTEQAEGRGEREASGWTGVFRRKQPNFQSSVIPL